MPGRTPDEDVESKLTLPGLRARVKGRGTIAAIAVIVAGIVALTWLHLEYDQPDRGSVTAVGAGMLLGMLAILVGHLTRWYR